MAPPQRKQEWFFESSKIEVNRNRKFSNFKCILYIALKFIFRIFIPPAPAHGNLLKLGNRTPSPPAPARPRAAPPTGRQRPTSTRPLPPPITMAPRLSTTVKALGMLLLLAVASAEPSAIQGE